MQDHEDDDSFECTDRCRRLVSRGPATLAPAQPTPSRSTTPMQARVAPRRRPSSCFKEINRGALRAARIARSTSTPREASSVHEAELVPRASFIHRQDADGAEQGGPSPGPVRQGSTTPCPVPLRPLPPTGRRVGALHHGDAVRRGDARRQAPRARANLVYLGPQRCAPFRHMTSNRRVETPEDSKGSPCACPQIPPCGSTVVGGARRYQAVVIPASRHSTSAHAHGPG